MRLVGIGGGEFWEFGRMSAESFVSAKLDEQRFGMGSPAVGGLCREIFPTDLLPLRRSEWDRFDSGELASLAAALFE